MGTFEVWEAPFWGAYSIITASLIVAALIVWNVLAWTLGKTVDARIAASLAGPFLALAVFVVAVALPVTHGQGDENLEYKVTQMEKLGYEYVELTGTKFTASSGGKFVRGTLMEEAGMIHVLEIPSE